MSSIGTLGQILPGGKIEDKIKDFAETVGTVGTALGGRSLITPAPSVNQTGTNNPAMNGHNILGTKRPVNTPRAVQGPQMPQQFGTTPVQRPLPAFMQGNVI